MAITLVEKPTDIKQTYKYSFTELKIKRHITQPALHKLIKKHNIKNDTNYNISNKSKLNDYYSEECLDFLKQQLTPNKF